MNSFNIKEYLLYILYYKKSSFFIILCFLLLINPVFAATDLTEPGGILNDATKLFKSQITVWYSGFKTVAVELLSILMVINIVWRTLSLGFRGNQFNDLFFEFIRAVVVFGFFLYLIETFSEWTEAIFKGFIGLADLAYSDIRTYGTASGMINNGINAFQDILDKVEPFKTDGVAGTVQNAIIWVFSMGVALFFGLVCLALWAFIGVNLAIQYVTFYFLTYAGVIFLAFAGTEWTRNTALNYLNAVLAAGVRYFATILVAAMSCKVFSEVVKTFSTYTSTGGATFVQGIIVPLVTLTLASFFAYKFSMKLPDMLAALVSPATNGVGVTAQGFSAATHLGSAAKALGTASKNLSMATAGLAAAGAGALGSKALDGVHDYMSGKGWKDAASGLTNFRAKTSDSISSGIKATGAAGKNAYQSAMGLFSDKAAGEKAFTQLMGNSNMYDGLAQQFGEQGANNKINEISSLGRGYTADAVSKGMSPSAAADFGFNRAKSEVLGSSGGSSAPNTISKGGDGADNGNSTNFSSGSGSPANTESNQEAGYRNIRDVMKDPISEDPVTDMNHWDPGDQFKS